MTSTYKTTYISGQLDPKQCSPLQNGSESAADEEVVEEMIGTGAFAETETVGFGTETTEAEEAASHKSLSSPPVFRPFTPAKSEGSEAEESDGSTDTESMFEAVEGWDESSLTESTPEAEPLIEAYYADAGAAEGSEEIFGAIAAAFLPVAKAVLPSLASVAVKTGAKDPRLQKLLARLSQLGLSPAKRRETGEGSDQVGELDEAALDALEQQLETLEVVIGRDDRVRISNTRAVPWKRICHLNIKTATGKSYLGTGFFVGPRTIITAGHCVYIHSQGGWVREIIVTPGRNGAETPFKSFTATSFRSVKGWVTDKARNYDYGAIILPKNVVIPSEIGTFGFASYANQSLLDKKLNTAGYPGDKPSGTLWFHGRKAKSVSARTITYDIDTAGGQSGSAVWIQDTSGRRIVVGIHTNGSPRGNSATRITKPVFENLKRWRAEGGKS